MSVAVLRGRLSAYGPMRNSPIWVVPSDAYTGIDQPFGYFSAVSSCQRSATSGLEGIPGWSGLEPLSCSSRAYPSILEPSGAVPMTLTRSGSPCSESMIPYVCPFALTPRAVGTWVTYWTVTIPVNAEGRK